MHPGPAVNNLGGWLGNLPEFQGILDLFHSWQGVDAVNNRCISIDGQNPKLWYDVFSSLKERGGQRRVKAKLFVTG
jgi:hypothetical protein